MNPLYTITIHSENTVGLLNQITTILTRRQINIESILAPPPKVKGEHEFTITVYAAPDIIEKVVKQIDKRIGVLEVRYK